MFETVIKRLDFDHFASGSHKIAFADFFGSSEGIFLDVRASEERDSMSLSFEGMGIEHVSIPIDQIPERIAELPKDRPIGVFCPTVVRSSIIYAYLLAAGFEQVWILDGGYPALAAELLPGKLRKHKLKKRPLEVA